MGDIAVVADTDKSVLKTIAAMDLEKINMDLVEDLLEWILDGNHDYPPGKESSLYILCFIGDAGLTSCFNHPGAVLVFLPGMAEIKTLYDRLMCNRMFRDPKRSVCLQQLWSLPKQSGCHRIISTNFVYLFPCQVCSTPAPLHPVK